MVEDEFSAWLCPPPTVTAAGLCCIFPDFLTAGIDCLIKGTEAHQCALFLCRWMDLCTRKADCRCAGGTRTPCVAYMVRIPFGILGVRLLLRAVIAAQTALGLQLPVGPREPWNVPVAPKAGQTTKQETWWHMSPGQGALNAVRRSVPLVLAKAGSSGSNQLHRAYFSPDSSAFAGAIVDSNESTWVVRVWVG